MLTKSVYVVWLGAEVQTSFDLLQYLNVGGDWL